MLTLSQTVDLLESRLIDTRIEDPPGEGRWQAAVMIMLRDPVEGSATGGSELLLIKRAENPRDYWSGHMALPGGRREAGDASLAKTAVRETGEEVGILPARLLGRMERLRPSNPRLPPVDITPFVALAPDGARVDSNSEVAAHFWVPLELLRRAGPSAVHSLDLGDGRRDWPAYPYEGNLIWGLTERILSQFLLLTKP